jgi:hypothetical protein
LRLAACGLRLAACGLRLAACGLRLAACGLQIMMKRKLILSSSFTLFLHEEIVPGMPWKRKANPTRCATNHARKNFLLVASFLSVHLCSAIVVRSS